MDRSRQSRISRITFVDFREDKEGLNWKLRGNRWVGLKVFDAILYMSEIHI